MWHPALHPCPAEWDLDAKALELQLSFIPPDETFTCGEPRPYPPPGEALLSAAQLPGLPARPPTLASLPMQAM